MIVDFRKDPSRAILFDVVDLDTGWHVHAKVFYADDEAGVFRAYHVEPGPGMPRLIIDATTGNISWYEVRRRIKIVPRAESPRNTGKPWSGRAPTWRDRPAML